MGLRSLLQTIEQRLPWGLLGFLIGAMGIALAVYYGVRYPTPRLTLDLINEVNVLDVRQPVPDLRIAFRGEDVQKANLNLRVFSAKIENVGDLDILQSHYDKDDAFGLKFDSGKLIEARLVDSNSGYVRAQLNPRVVNDNIVQLSKVILERGKYFTLDILVLHSKEKIPDLILIGKIAGIDATPTTRMWLERGQPSFWSDTFSGRVLIQTTRLVAYFLAGVALIVGTVAVGSLIETGVSSARRRQRQRHATVFVDGRDPDDRAVAKALADVYTRLGREGLLALKEGLDDPKALKGALASYEFEEKQEQQPVEEFDPRMDLMIVRRHLSLGRRGLVTLLKLGALKKEGDVVVPLTGLKEALAELLAEGDRLPK